MDLLKKLDDGLVFFDGGMGTMLEQYGLLGGEPPERRSITHPHIIRKIHADYAAAGCDVITANTFGANALKYSDSELERIISSAVENAKQAALQCFTALDIGPLGRLLKPLGTLDFEQAVEIFAKTVRIGASCGADLIIIETMTDTLELKAAVLAAKENSNLPVFATAAFDDNQQLMTGANVQAVTALLEGLGVDALGVNCSTGPRAMLPVVEQFVKYSSKPVIVNPNAGLPESDGVKTVYNLSAQQFAHHMKKIVTAGARIIGGCCGTTPQYISEMKRAVSGMPVRAVTKKSNTSVSSYTHTVNIKDGTVIIGERINPTGKPRLRQAIKSGDIGHIMTLGIEQAQNGAHLLDINVGVEGIDEPEMMVNGVTALQSVTDLPLCIDTSDVKALEAAMRVYNGKPLINSVNGKRESMHAVFPLVKKYGGVVIALTLDENGIPDSVEERIAIAHKIIAAAQEYGISKNDIIVDPLAMTISTGGNNADICLECVRKLHCEGICTSLGVSNISFGLPHREKINSAFFVLALENGLSAAILNPASEEMMSAYRAFEALKGIDESCTRYISYASGAQSVDKPDFTEMTLKGAIVGGLGELAARLASTALQTEEPMSIINERIIPALDEVGRGFEDGSVYLPQLLMSAQAATAAFDAVRDKMGGIAEKREGKIVLATVLGDIHDIGKNIVKVLLCNYGFDVIDLGKDVPPEKIVAASIENNAAIVGLSALMTTTVTNMEKTIKLLRESGYTGKTVVGGAVLTEDYAKRIGADCYAKDAMDTVRYAIKETAIS